MTEQEKQLLLKDLCTRTPYRVLMQVQNCKEECKHHLFGINFEDNTVRIDHCNESDEKIYINDWRPISDCKPYLRPMSSMTENERYEYLKFIIDETDDEARFLNKMVFYNKYHFDYHGLIEKGLALEAPEGMYND